MFEFGDQKVIVHGLYTILKLKINWTITWNSLINIRSWSTNSFAQVTQKPSSTLVHVLRGELGNESAPYHDCGSKDVSVIYVPANWIIGVCVNVWSVCAVWSTSKSNSFNIQIWFALKIIEYTTLPFTVVYSDSKSARWDKLCSSGWLIWRWSWTYRPQL